MSEDTALSTFTLEAVWIRRQRYWTNGYRPVPKWNPGAVDHNGEPIKNAGKASKGAGWREAALENPPRWVRLRPESNALGTGFLTGELVTVDVDVDDRELADQVVAMVEARAGRTVLVRQGRAPKLALCYRAAGNKPYKSLRSAELVLPDGRKVMLEVLADGHSLTADAIHPDTGEPYRWLDQHPLDVPLCDLGELSEARARDLAEEAEQMLREAGAVELRPREEKTKRPRNPTESFFEKVNEAALKDPERWVRAVFPKAKKAPNGGWRIPAPLRGSPASKQDIGIFENGIRDFHENRSMSPIDFVVMFNRIDAPVDAAMWLCRELGIAPHDLGWQDRLPPPIDEVPPWCSEPPEEPGGPDGPAPPSPPAGPAPPSELPVILVRGGFRHEAVDAALGALERQQSVLRLFVRDLELVTIAPWRRKTSEGEIIKIPSIRRLGVAGLGRMAGQSARWMRYDHFGALQRIDPPRPVIEQILEVPPSWPFPPLSGLITAPTLRPDFTLLDKEGYDPQTGCYCDFAGLKLPAIPANPTRRQAETAVQLLLEPVDTFPWVDAPSRSGAVAGVITPVVRSCLDVVPMCLVTARVAGSGKTYFVNLCSAIATGQAAAVMAMGVREFEKRLVMAALNGHPIIVIDNVRRLLEGDLLCQLVEQRSLGLRPLGTSDKIDVLNCFTVYATGNNAQVTADLGRRVIRPALDANMANPEKKEHARKRLREEVLARRGEYVAAALTVVLYYRQAGRPNALPWLASYGLWSDNVRSALVHLGLADPVETMGGVQLSDPARMHRTAVFETWAEAATRDLDAVEKMHGRGFLTKELIALASQDGEFRDALFEVAEGRGKKAGELDGGRLGNWLLETEGTIASNYKLLCDRTARNARWRLQEMS
jgi:hypothetical protein